MMQAFFTIVVLVYYISIFIELLVFAVPSPVSTYQVIQKKQRNRFYTLAASLLALLAFIMPLFSVVFSFFDLNFLETKNHTALLICSIILIITGRFFTLWGMLNIRTHLKKKDSSILKTGIFSISRHPIATGLFISLLGFNLAFLNGFLFILSVVFIVNLNNKVLLEENLLLQQNETAYAAYKNQTRRYL